MKDIKDLKIKTLEGLSVKNYKTFPSREWGNDGGMQADVYLNSTLVGTVYDAGDGGVGDFYPTSTANVDAFKEACFKFLKRKGKDYFKYSYAEALECAKEWSKESPDTEIVIDKVTKEYQIVTFKGGRKTNG